MAFFNDVKFRSTTSGTGSFGIGAPMAAFQSAVDAGMTNGQTHSYSARTANQFESGLGTLNTSTNEWERTEIDDSSNGGSLVDFTSPPIVGLNILARDLTITISFSP